MLRAVITALTLCVCAWCDQAEAKRVALVIGNAAYRKVSPLANPLNDARLVARALAASGFDVQFGTDLDRKAMQAALQEFALDAMQADVAIVYFAGHGLEANGANWLVPVDAGIASSGDVPAAAVPFEMVARSLAGASVKIVALDACRDNPFAARLQSATGTINRGLAEVELDGYVVMYAAAAGHVAHDGKTGNSPFAQSFARWVGEQNIDLRLLAGKIRDDVIASTAGAQRPFVSASLPGKVTPLAPASDGIIRDVAAVRRRKPYYFDFVRTLSNSACTPARTVKCETKSVMQAAGRLITIGDDEKLRLWDTKSESVSRTETLPPAGPWGHDVTFLASSSTLVVTTHDSITMIPLGAGAPQTHTIEHYDNPQFLFVTKAPALAAYDYPGWCRLGFVDLGSFTLMGKMSWEAECFKGQAAWSITDPASDRFAVRVATIYKNAPKREELLLASYQSRKVLCRVAAAANDAAFGADGDLYAAQDDGTVTRYDQHCRAKQTLRLHQSAIEQILILKGERMLSRSVDGALKLWSPASGKTEKELAGLSRDAKILSVAEDGSAVLILNDDRRLYLWYGEPRLGPYIGPSGPVCAGVLSDGRDAVYALKCEGNVELWRRQQPH
jgi:Caspase domain